METKIQGYNFDGDPDGIKFLYALDAEELQTLIYDTDNKGKANFFDSRNNYHYEITRSQEYVYMVSKVQAPSSSWF